MFIVLYVQGVLCKNKKDAIQSAAFNACIELYKIGALDEDLKPMSIENNIKQNYLKWFPHWDEKNIKHGKYQLITGTHKTNRIVHSEVSYCI